MHTWKLTFWSTDPTTPESRNLYWSNRKFIRPQHSKCLPAQHRMVSRPVLASIPVHIYADIHLDLLYDRFTIYCEFIIIQIYMAYCAGYYQLLIILFATLGCNQLYLTCNLVQSWSIWPCNIYTCHTLRRILLQGLQKLAFISRQWK